MARRRFDILNRIEALGKLAPELESFGLAQGVPLPVLNDLNIALDEIVTNTLSYGYPDGADHKIIVDMDVSDVAVTIEVTDDAMPFDPLRAPEPDLSGGLHERRLGGAGLRFVRHLTDACCYRRADGRNHLRLTRRIGTDGPQAGE